MRNKNIIKICVALAIGLVTSFSASAAVLNGDIKFSGTATLNGDGTAANATGITFVSTVTTATGSTGDFSGVASDIPVTTKNISWGSSGFTGYLPGGTITDMWKFSSGGVEYSFDLQRITYNAVGGDTLSINGWGLVSSDQVGNTAQMSEFRFRQTSTDATIAFSSTTDVSDSGTTVAFLGLSMLGLAGAARRLRK